MKKITINSYAKINLSLDVKGVRPDGYHEVETYMQILDFSDEVKIRWYSFEDRREELLDAEKLDKLDKVDIKVSTNRPYLPNDERNLAYQAAQIMADRYFDGHQGGLIRIDIKKRIPVAAGLAGGSGNAAAVILGLNRLWGLKLNVQQMMRLGEDLGADVPFCIMSQAHSNLCLGSKINKDPMASTAAIGRGTGTDLTPAPSVPGYVVLTKPRQHVSTAEVYKGIDAEIQAAENAGLTVKHPNTSKMAQAIRNRNYADLAGEMNNVLEYYTLKRYPGVAILKMELSNANNPVKTMMSGSGPSLFALYTDYHIALNSFEKIKEKCHTTYMVETL